MLAKKYNTDTSKVKAQVEVFREEEHKKSLTSSATQPFLLPHEESPSKDEKDQLVDARIMQR